jgi:tRNA(adenine34) deaminase
VTDIDDYWLAAFTLAWEAFQERSIPVGAVLVDGAGTIVGRGRNRMGGILAPAGQIAGSRIAHAEINTLAELPPGDYADHILYSTLEPCYLCTMALRFSHVGTVRFAATDPLWYGIDQLPGLNHHLARRWTRREGSPGGRWEEFSLLLMHISAIEQGARNALGDTSARASTLDLAQRLAGAPADRLRESTLPEALAELQPQLAP